MLDFRDVGEGRDMVAPAGLGATFFFPLRGKARPPETDYEIAAMCFANNTDDVANRLWPEGGTTAGPNS